MAHKLDRFIISYNGNKYNETKKYLSQELHQYANYDIIAEPFCGIFGFSRAFAEIHSGYNGQIWLNDIDGELIEFYRMLKADSEKWLIDAYDTVNKYSNDKEYTDDKTKDKFIEMIGRGSSFRLMQISKANRKIINYTEKLELYKTFWDKVTLFNLPNNEFLELIPDNGRALVYFDPPYLDSNNTQYSKYSINKDYTVYKDNTTIYLELLEYFKNTNNLVLFVMNKCDIINHLFKDYVYKDYSGAYQNNLPGGLRSPKYHVVYKKDAKIRKVKMKIK